MPNAAPARDEIPRLLEQLLDLAEQLDNGKRSPLFREIEERTDEIATLVAADAEFISANTQTGEVAADAWGGYHLTKTERVILDYFLGRPGRFIPRTTLFHAVYGDRDNEPEPKVLDVFMCKIRRKIIKSGFTIVSDYNGSFKFVAQSEVKSHDRLPPVFVEWRGVLMGSRQAQIADALHTNLGKIVTYEQLAAAAGEFTHYAVMDRMTGVRDHIAKTPYEIVTIPGQGYRMQLRQTPAQRAA